jgi:gamma-glutamyltranspeptidase/glutathione hydrolase
LKITNLKLSNLKRISFLLIVLLLTFMSCAKPSKQLEFGAVASASPEATKAGMHILSKGGNAVDAAIAVSFALSVSEPAMSGIGGGTQIQIFFPGKPQPFALNGSSISPDLTPALFDKDNLKEHLRTTIPSTVKVLGYLYDNYSSKKLNWAELIQPAIEIAENGFEMGSFRRKVYDRYQEKLSTGMPFTSEYYPLLSNNNSQQRKIAKALKIIAVEGADAFYNGKIARSITDDMAKNGGWITQEDLARFPNPEILPSIHFKHNGYDIYTQPNPCGGQTVKEILEKLTSLRNEQPDEIDLLHKINAIHYGHGQRRLNAQKAINLESGETTHFSVMDSEGIAISVTSSINAYYGAGVANPDYGFLYNSYMDDFNFDDKNNKYAIGPNKMAYSSMSPTIVMKDNQVELVIGSPGSARIISTVAQLIDIYTLRKIEPEKLLEMPRVHAINQKVYLEDPILKGQIESLGSFDLEIVQPNAFLTQNGLNAYFGGVHAIVWTGTSYIALADPRRDGLAITN